MPYRNEVRPLNLFADYLGGRRAAIDEEGAQQVNALRATQVQSAQSVNALAQNPNATPEQYIRAGDTQTGVALGNEQQSQATNQMQAAQELSSLVKRANITSPQQARDFTRQIAQQYGQHFQAMGVDLNKSLGDLDSTPDDVLMQRLTQVAQFAAPQKPIEVNKGASLVVPNAQGTGVTPLYTPPPETMSPYQQAELGLNRERLNFEKSKPPPSSVPSGYEPDPANPGAVRPVKGGPKDPDASTGMDSRSSVMFNRVASSAQAAVKAIQNIAELPITTSSGIFGTAEPGHGLFASARNVLAQKVTGQEAQDFKTMVAGVSRNLSTIETAGLAPNGAITNSMNAVLLGEGDTQMTKLRKLAEMRQIVEENLKPQLANPKLAPAQKDLVRQIISSVQESVPFTHRDITLLQRSKNPEATIMDFATQAGLPSSGAPGNSNATPAAAGWTVQKVQ